MRSAVCGALAGQHVRRLVGLLGILATSGVAIVCPQRIPAASQAPRARWTSGEVRTITKVEQPEAIIVSERMGRAFIIDKGKLDSAGNYSAYKLHVLETSTASMLHSVDLGFGSAAMALAERAGHVFVAAATQKGGESVAMLDARTGTVLRLTPVGGLVPPGGIAVDERRGNVFVADTGTGLDRGAPWGVSVLAATSGRLLGTVPDGTGSAVVAERAGRVFVADQNGPYVTVLDATLPPGPRMFLLNTPTMLPGPYIQALTDPLDLVVAEWINRVVVAAVDGGWVLDARTGVPVGRFDADARDSGAVLAADTRTRRVFLSAGRWLYVIDAVPPRGQRFVRYQYPAAYSRQRGGLIVDEQTGQVFAAAGDHVDVRDGTTGRLLRAVRVPATALALDTRTRRVFSIDDQSGIVSAFSADP